MKNATTSFLTATIIAYTTLARSATVTTTADSGTGSLRDTIAHAAAGDTVDFSVSGTITLTSGELVINKTLTVTGPGASQLAVLRSTAGGTPSFRIFGIQSGIVALFGLTLRQGQAEFGGGLDNEATLTVRDCAIVRNSASQRGNRTGASAGGAYGGGINNAGTLTAIRCVIATNTASVAANADSFGGGIYNDGALSVSNSVINANSATGGASVNANGGGIFNQATLDVSQSTIALNAAIGGNGMTGGSGQAGGIGSSGTLTVDRCTLSGNVAAGGNSSAGAGGAGQGGGILNTFDIYLASSTVSSNTAVGGSGATGVGVAQGGGIYLGGLASYAVLTNSTVTANGVSMAGRGGGVFNSSGVVIMTNTILAGNVINSQDFINGPAGDVESGFNLIGSTNGPVSQVPATSSTCRQMCSSLVRFRTTAAPLLRTRCSAAALPLTRATMRVRRQPTSVGFHASFKRRSILALLRSARRR